MHNRDIFSSFSNMKVCCLNVILMSTNNIPFPILNRNSPEIIPNTIITAAMGSLFVRDSRTSLK